MTGSRLFYHPYATMFDAQLPLVKTAAMYVDNPPAGSPRRNLGPVARSPQLGVAEAAE